jgi:CheY-specific phosphatase CheX
MPSFNESNSTTSGSLNEDTLARLVTDALERTAFVMADPCDDPDRLPPADTFAQIDFRGPESGAVDLRASRAFARNLAASLLGTDASEITDAQAEEALRELANIVGGSVITALGGDDCRFSLGLPALGNHPPDANATCCTLDAEGERLEVSCIHRLAA